MTKDILYDFHDENKTLTKYFLRLCRFCAYPDINKKMNQFFLLDNNIFLSAGTLAPTRKRASSSTRRKRTSTDTRLIFLSLMGWPWTKEYHTLYALPASLDLCSFCRICWLPKHSMYWIDDYYYFYFTFNAWILKL